MKLKKHHSFKGQLLVASPHIRDDVFSNSVVFICTHDQEGSLGLIINRPLETVTCMELMAQLDLKSNQAYADEMIYFGGPIDVNRGFILHEAFQGVDEPYATQITDDIALSTSLKYFKNFPEIITADEVSKMRLTLGYAGWSQGQLENEIKAGDWLSINASKDMIFSTPATQLWEKAYETLKIDPYQLSGRVGHS